MSKLNFTSFSKNFDELAKVLVARTHELTWGADPTRAATWFVGVTCEAQPNLVYKCLIFTERQEALHAYQNLSAWLRDVNFDPSEA